jgi:hypothetical protein
VKFLLFRKSAVESTVSVRCRTEHPAVSEEDVGNDVPHGTRKENCHALYTIALVMIVLWFLGLLTAYTFGGFIHILLGIALVVVLIRLFEGRRPL